MRSTTWLRVQNSYGAIATCIHCASRFVGTAAAAMFNVAPRPVGRAYIFFFSHRTNETRTSLNHLGFYGYRQLLADVWSSTIASRNYS